MIHLEVCSDIAWAKQVDMIQIIENDSTEPVLYIPRVSIIGFFMEATNVPTDGCLIDVLVSTDNETWYPYTIVNRVLNAATGYFEDDLYPLRISIKKDGNYTYALDTLYHTNYLKLVQNDTQTELNIKLTHDAIW